MATLEEVAVKFWAKVDILGPDDCWLWTGGVDGSGYGQFGQRTNASLIFRYIGECRTSRVAYHLTFGPIPEGMLVMHKCDVRRCCNPRHLTLGTSLDNQQDMTIKGRSARPKGAANPMATLTESDVLTIRKWSAEGSTGREIAIAMMVSEATISLILSGKLWGWL